MGGGGSFVVACSEKEGKERMLEGKALVEDTDMPAKMQAHAMASASQALDLYDVVDCKSIAAHIKKVLSSLPLEIDILLVNFLKMFRLTC